MKSPKPCKKLTIESGNCHKCEMLLANCKIHIPGDGNAYCGRCCPTCKEGKKKK